MYPTSSHPSTEHHTRQDNSRRLYVANRFDVSTHVAHGLGRTRLMGICVQVADIKGSSDIVLLGLVGGGGVEGRAGQWL